MDNYPIKILKPSESILRAFFTNNNQDYVYQKDSVIEKDF